MSIKNSTKNNIQTLIDNTYKSTETYDISIRRKMGKKVY